MAHDHVVQFYERDEELVASAGAYLAEAVMSGDVAVSICAPAHRSLFESYLVSAGIDVATAVVDGTYVVRDAADTLSRFLVDGMPDAAMFDSVVGGLVRRAAASGRRVRGFGEMVALLWDAGNVPAALALEDLWNDLGQEIEFALYCAYPSASVAGVDDGFGRVCDVHDEVLEQRSDAVCWFPATPHGATAARHFVVGALTERGRVDLLDDAALVVTELAANAALHAKSEFTVELSWRGDAVRIAVRDSSDASPRVRAAQPLDTGGRGLRLVAAVADRWGTQPFARRSTGSVGAGGAGKVVWAELRP